MWFKGFWWIALVKAFMCHCLQCKAIEKITLCWARWYWQRTGVGNAQTLAMFCLANFEPILE
ncbi:MAG: hypothetical protein LBF22_03120 [Deltaproteobacteria bacterium]|nr:hypothetical protein [Deltaproteobacteria bacterium]